MVEFKPLGKPNDPKDYGFAASGKFTLIVINESPEVKVSPSTITAKPGETVLAEVSATDEDEDTITLTKVFGPGTFPSTQGKGQAQGNWSWTVPNVCGDSLRRVFVVGFNATDSCGAKSGSSLVVRIRCPPKAHDAFALVPRGGSSTAMAYVYAPDELSLSVKVEDVPSGLSVSAHVEDDPFPPGMGGFMVVFDVSADSTLCDGVYPIPFTVTDQDGLSSRATLYVQVDRKDKFSVKYQGKNWP